MLRVRRALNQEEFQSESKNFSSILLCYLHPTYFINVDIIMEIVIYNVTYTLYDKYTHYFHGKLCQKLSNYRLFLFCGHILVVTLVIEEVTFCKFMGNIRLSLTVK